MHGFHLRCDGCGITIMFGSDTRRTEWAEQHRLDTAHHVYDLSDVVLVEPWRGTLPVSEEPVR
jgi:hypothetical protein